MKRTENDQRITNHSSGWLTATADFNRSVQGDSETMTCPFCDFRNEEMKKRIFYRDEDWFAILAAPYHNKGHAILAAVQDLRLPYATLITGPQRAIKGTIESN